MNEKPRSFHGDRLQAMVVIGTRPEAIKLAPVIKALELSDWADVFVVLTGQHVDLIDPLIEHFNLKVHHHLRVMQPNQSLASLTARMLEGLDQLLVHQSPRLVIGQGDTASVLAGSMASFFRQIPFAHVEAGLRTGDLRSPFPEELNRVLTSRMSQWHFAPTELARAHLLAESIPASQIFLTGNTVIDALQLSLSKGDAGQTGRERGPDDLWQPLLASVRPLILITAHRRENFGEPLARICHAVRRLASRYFDHDFVYPVHPNPQVRQTVTALLADQPNIHLMPPADYASFCRLMQKARLILSDSGGVQEEAPALGKPVLVLRTETERPEAVSLGCNRLVGTETAAIENAVVEVLENTTIYQAMATAGSPYGDGRAAKRIERVLRRHLIGDEPVTTSV